MRKAICLLLCAVIFVFAGCSAKAMTEQEYIDSFKSVSKTYLEASKDYLTAVSNKEFDTPLYDIASQALDDLEKLSPPEEYKELHKELCEAINDEREILSLIKETLQIAAKLVYGEAVSDEEAAKVSSNSIRLNELASSSKFSTVMLDIANKYKERNP